MLAKKLGVGIGPYYHIAGSLHLYEKELQKVQAAFGLESKRRSMIFR
jgi:thymidylate synthase